jgi:hypothetical protein
MGTIVVVRVVSSVIEGLAELERNDFGMSTRITQARSLG